MRLPSTSSGQALFLTVLVFLLALAPLGLSAQNAPAISTNQINLPVPLPITLNVGLN